MIIVSTNLFLYSTEMALKSGQTVLNMKALGEMEWLRDREHSIMQMVIFRMDNSIKIMLMDMVNILM